MINEMSFDEFVAAVNADHYVQNDNGFYLSIEWVTSGMTGGNCWGGVAEPREADTEPDFDSLYAVIDKLAPELNSGACARVKHELTWTREFDGCGLDYYGNYENYTERKIDLKMLYDFLVEQKALIAKS